MKFPETTSATLSSIYGPILIVGTPSTTSEEIFVTVSIGGMIVTQNNLIPAAPNLVWNNIMADGYTTSGALNARFEAGADANVLTTGTTTDPSTPLTWSSSYTGSSSYSGQVFTW